MADINSTDISDTIYTHAADVIHKWSMRFINPVLSGFQEFMESHSKGMYEDLMNNISTSISPSQIEEAVTDYDNLLTGMLDEFLKIKKIKFTEFLKSEMDQAKYIFEQNKYGFNENE